ncbi:putative MFS family arabinose efflux permease [Acinetobacter calcoaceticus]|uniref:Putative MFS family arabinose efflux permease n=1 Tax=Acinetobacter calcoaceticus TaxID=471 RepID=A0A4R1Y1S3_ACICA|nr:putative MFS family arabinose efflux permease [Acinetobacter calcoaceticus]
MSVAPPTIDAQTDAPFRMPVSALLALALAGFLTLSTETIPAGMLSHISVGMDISASMAGQFISIYALGSVLTVIPLITLTRRWPRRHLLLSALIGLLLFNSMTALTSNLELALVSRFCAGMAGGVMWGMLAGYARRMVPEHLKGRALAIAGVGAPLALSIGVPLGAWLSEMIGWRFTFMSLSALTLIAIIWTLVALPNYAGESTQQKKASIAQVLANPSLRMVLLILVLWVMAHNILYTYIVPYLSPIGLAGRADVILMIFGIASMGGVWLSGVFIDRMLGRMVLINLGLFALAILAFAYLPSHPIMIVLAVAAWGFSVGSSPVLLQTACADSAGPHADVAQSILVTVWNSALAAGGMLGGVLLQQFGVMSFPWAMLSLVILALIVVQLSRHFLFVPATH